MTKTAEVTFDFVEELTADIAVNWLGMEVVEDTTKTEPACRLRLWNEEKGKLVSTPVIFRNNSDNRPIRVGIANRYANEMLRRKWVLNGETLIFDDKGQAVSCQHRLVALIIAENMRLAGDAIAKTYKWRGPVSISAFVVTGVDHKTADTVDQGTGRTGADVLFRRREFSKKYSDKEQKTLSKILAGAARLVWIRMGGKNVSDAPKFLHSEMLDFIKKHKFLKDCATFVMEENSDDNAIKERISLPYMAGLMFLFAYSNGADENGKPLEDTQELAERFVTLFARGSQDRGTPTRELWEFYGRMLQNGTRDRDTIVNSAVKAWIAFSENKEMSAKEIRPKKDENPRCGGYDVELEEAVEDEAETSETTTEEAEVTAEAETEKPKRRRRKRQPKQEEEPAEV